MSKARSRTITLPDDDARFLDEKVASGEYASDSEVIEAGLDALREREEHIERWLREEVAPAYDAMKADPGRALSLDDTFAQLREHSASFRQENE